MTGGYPDKSGFFCLSVKKEVKKMTTNSKNPETLALHAGWRSDPTTNSVAVPIHQQLAINLTLLNMLQIFLLYPS